MKRIKLITILFVLMGVQVKAQQLAHYKGNARAAVSYTFDKRPKRIVQKGKRLKPYKSWDGTWCVDALRGVKMTVKY